MDTSSSRNKSNGSAFHHGFNRSTSPSGRFCSSSSTFSPFSARSGPPIARSRSPPRVNLYRSVSPSPSVRFSSTSPGRSISVAQRQQKPTIRQPFASSASNQKKTCACSPTTHPGSFRCSLHKNMNNRSHHQASPYRSSHNLHLNMRRSAMTNSLVRIGTVEGDLVKRALASLIRPSSHHLRRRGDFQPRPSRLSVMSQAEDSQ